MSFRRWFWWLDPEGGAPPEPGLFRLIRMRGGSLRVPALLRDGVRLSQPGLAGKATVSTPRIEGGSVIA